MRMSAKIFLAAVVVSAGGGMVLWPYVKMSVAESAHYTEQDKAEYAFYTPELLRNLPRVSKDYEFGYANVSGPGLLIYDVRFSGTTDVSRITTYLEDRGYTRLARCDIAGTCWKSSEPGISVSVGVVPEPATIIVSLVDEPSGP